MKLLPEPGSDGAALGVAVAATPEWLIAGAPGWDDDRGTAFLYHRNGATWVEHSELLPPLLPASACYGNAVAMTDEFAVIGAVDASVTQLGGGLISVFRYDRTTWLFEHQFDGPVINAALGYSVALHGNLLVAGAPFANDLRGAVHVYRRGAAGWVEEAVLPQPSRPHSEQYFGTAVAVHGNWLAVGEGAEIDTPGRAFLYHYESGEWRLHTTLDYPSSCISCNYGARVSLGDGWFAVSGDTSSAPAELYEWDGAAWVLDGTFATTVSLYGNYFVETGNQGLDANLYYRSADDWIFASEIALPPDERIQGRRSWVGGAWLAWGESTDDDAGDAAGAIFVIPLPIDCNNNGISDACDIATGSSSDADADGVPDDCQPNPCPRGGCENLDIAGNDCVIDLGDLGLLLANFNREGWDIAGDSDTDGDVDLADLGAMLAAWGNNCTLQAAEDEPR